MHVSGLDPRCGPESPGGTSQKYWLSPQETWFPLLGICVLKAFQDEKHFRLLFEAGTKLYFSCTKAVHTARPHAPGDRSLGDVLVTRNPSRLALCGDTELGRASLFFPTAGSAPCCPLWSDILGENGLPLGLEMESM